MLDERMECDEFASVCAVNELRVISYLVTMALMFECCDES